MNKAVELYIKCYEAKSSGINSFGHGSYYHDTLAREELFATLDLTNTEHDLGMLIIKSMYLNNDACSK
ncbi:hypothetical protein [Psychromonas hadalis]|uniref:hypothetical protein n=1 Tax=Psychromonas hadalis TaxID=211669 RepID=UPI0003B4D975|nr:hypothetical protein [Psychromonas hadalis]